MKINKYILSTLSIAALFAAACGDDDDRNTNTEQTEVSDNVVFEAAPSNTLLTSGPVEVITEDTVRYHVLLPAEGIFTVTMVETATDLILVDVGPGPEFLPTLGTELRTYANAIGKPLSIIMTHNHFDHWGNMDDFADVQVYSHSDVAPLLMADSGFTSLYPNADSIISVSSSQEIGGLTFNFETIQNAETGENGYIYIESLQAVFVADLVYNRAHNFIREYTPLDGTNEIDNWLTGLGVLSTKFGTYNHIFCGHNGTTTDIPTVINENIEYLRIAQNLISGERLLSTGVKASMVEEVVAELDALYPNYVVSGLNFALPGAFGEDDPGADWFE